MTEVEEGLVPLWDQSISYFGHTACILLLLLGAVPSGCINRLIVILRGVMCLCEWCQWSVQEVPVHESRCNVWRLRVAAPGTSRVFIHS